MKHIRSLLVVFIGLFVAGFRRGRSEAKKHKRPIIGRWSEYIKGVPPQGPQDLTTTGWKVALKLTWAAIKDKNLVMMAAALAYYATLAFFPATLGVASLYTTIAGPAQLAKVLSNLHSVIPSSINSLMQTELSPLTHATRGSLGLATIISLALLLWTTSGGVSNLVKGTNIAYGVDEERGFIKLRLVSVVLSLVFIAFALIMALLLVLNGHSLHQFGVPMALAQWFPWVRWLLLIVFVSLILSIIYRYTPNRREPRWSWVSWGASAATILWLIVTGIFFFYVQHFGNYNKSYGVFASIIILMIWFNLSAILVLAGAQVNQKMEAVSRG